MDPLIDYWRMVVKLNVPAFVNVDTFSPSEIAKAYAVVTTNGFDAYCKIVGIKQTPESEAPIDVDANNAAVLNEIQLPEIKTDGGTQ